MYGAGVKGNFARLVESVKKGYPLPFKFITNKRSFIGVKNLVGFIVLSIREDDVGGEVFLVNDGHDLTIQELVNIIAGSLGRRCMSFPLPVFLLRALFFVAGRSREWQRVGIT